MKHALTRMSPKQKQAFLDVVNFTILMSQGHFRIFIPTPTFLVKGSAI